MTIRFQGHVEKQEHYSAQEVKLTIHGDTAITTEKIVVLCRIEDAALYIGGRSVQIQIHPL